MKAHFSQEVLEHWLFTQSLEGIFFMMLDEPVEWNDRVNKDEILEYVFDHQRVTEINEAMLLQYEAKRQDFLGKTPRDFFAHDVAYGKEVWREFFDQGKLRIDTSERKFNGKEMWICGEYVCLYDDQKRIIGHFGIQREITEEKRKEKALAKLNEAKDRMVATVAHDLRNPINSILGLAELMALECENVQDYVKMLKETGQRALRIIQELLEVAEMESENYRLKTEKIDPNLVGKHLYERFAAEATSKNIHLHFVPCAAPIYVQVHQEKFGRVIENLLSNALKFTPAGKNIYFTIDSNGLEVFFRIKDEGIGIPETMREILFDKFTKAKRLGLQGEKTTGLGMYIVKQIIDLHHGTINVSSEENKGTEFCITLCKE